MSHVEDRNFCLLVPGYREEQGGLDFTKDGKEVFDENRP